MKKLLIAVTLASTLAVTGCGGTDATAELKTTLSKAEFIKKADSICAASEARLEKSGADISEDTSLEEIRAFLEKKVIPEVTTTVAQLRELRPPQVDAEKIDRLLDEVEAEIIKVKKDPMAIMGDGAFARARKQAADYGLTTCLQ
jgi:predicted Zn-dependent peptidase